MAQKITSKSFLNRPFPNKMTLETLQEYYGKKLKISFDTVRNIHNNEMDKLITGNVFRSEFKFYQSSKKQIFYEAKIKSKKIYFRKKVHIGMKKADFLAVFKKLKMDINSNEIKFENREKTNSCTFVFKNDKLKFVHLQYYLD